MLRVRRRLLIGAASILMTFAAACSVDRVSTSEEATSTAVQGDIGVVLSLSGPNAAYGNPTRAGMELALADLGEGKGPGNVAFTASFLDDEGDAMTGADEFQRHVDDGALAILGPTLSNTAFAAHPVAQNAGVPVLAVTNTADGITDTGDYVFRVSLGEAAVVPQTVDAVASEFAPQTAALVFSGDDAWSRSSADAFRDAADEHGIEIVTEQDVPADGGDAPAAVNVIADADPDIIMLSALEHSSIDVVLEARQQGLEQRFVCGNGCNTGTFIAETGDASEGLVVGSAWHIDRESGQSHEFVERYREMHGSEPDQFSAQGYAGIQILAEAASTLGSLDRAELREALAGLGEVETVLGTFSFDENRNGSHPAVIKIIESGEFAILR